MTWRGVTPGGTVPYRCENVYVYGAGEPTPGERFCLEWPSLNTVTFQIFLDEVAPPSQDTLKIVRLEKGSCQRANALVIPDKVACLFLPP
jgi:hypothetical protein